MVVVILAGGLGTRLGEETTLKPKPMVEVGGKPILWHIMNIYSCHGYRDFLIACGYKGHVIKEYFQNFQTHNSDWIVNLADGSRRTVGSSCPPWQVGVVDTGTDTMTGGRLLRLGPWVADRTCLVTYGDGVGDVDIGRAVEFHRSHGRLATITAVHPPARFGSIRLEGERVIEFVEKPQTENDWINGGFFVFEPGVFAYLSDDQTVLEREPLERLAADGQLLAYRHSGFWQPMDTLREKELLEGLWRSGQAPWKIWQDQPYETFQFLPEPTRPDHRPHGFQGPLARRVA